LQGGGQRIVDSRLSKFLALISLAFVALLWSHPGPYKLDEFVRPWFPYTYTLHTLIYTVAAILLMGMALYVPIVRDSLNNRIGAVLGQISFPLYLVHLLVICSISSWAYIHLRGLMPDFLVVALVLVLTGVITVALAWLLSKMDQMIIRTLDRTLFILNGCLAASQSQLLTQSMPERREKFESET
ncbi:MAG: hypothetical protein C5B47_07960, partial [Verrucomicrobia bacterium]